MTRLLTGNHRLISESIENLRSCSSNENVSFSYVSNTAVFGEKMGSGVQVLVLVYVVSIHSLLISILSLKNNGSFVLRSTHNWVVLDCWIRWALNVHDLFLAFQGFTCEKYILLIIVLAAVAACDKPHPVNDMLNSSQCRNHHGKSVTLRLSLATDYQS